MNCNFVKHMYKAIFTLHFVFNLNNCGGRSILSTLCKCLGKVTTMMAPRLLIIKFSNYQFASN